MDFLDLHPNTSNVGWLIHTDRGLGAGAWGKVFYATKAIYEESTLRGITESACKIVLMDTVEKIKLTRNEIDILRDITHPNIIRMLDFRITPTQFELYLEYFPERDLDDRLIRYPSQALPHHECKVVFRQLLDALIYLHDRNIVHRDIKCENILVRSKHESLHVVLCDFGLSKKLQRADEWLTDWVGSALHASPELVHRKAYRKGPDVWAFGVLVYILLTGDCPFNEIESDRSDSFANAVPQLLRVTDTPNYEHILLTSESIDVLKKILVVDQYRRPSIKEVGSYEYFNTTS